ncbi:hypothetical protein F383_17593 [Gossypium arboreum]|uniref:Uncharacterized protein n=1 Tax=Gossypium arboreum TaxID=29729 RepID=A0A0B0MIE5_GOSAR|nr:hypothetical protein F383_17593 [Gossypium arboreum]
MNGLKDEYVKLRKHRQCFDVQKAPYEP